MSSRLMIKNAMESIWFQDGNFGKELERIITNLRAKKSLDQAQKSDDCTELERCIFEFTGILNEVVFDDFTFAATLPPLVNMNHVFKNDGYSLTFTDSDSAFKNIKKLQEESTVNYAQGKVSGSFSKLQSFIYLGFNSLVANNDFDVKEVVAILLHEIGHNFTHFEFLNRFVTTNQVLALVSKSIMDKETIEERSILIKKSGKVICDDEKAFEGYEEITDIKILTNVFLDGMLRRAGSELGCGYYDQTAMESLADQYAARHGYGRYLITGLDKVVKDYSYEHNSASSKKMMHILEIVTTVTGIIAFAVIPLTLLSAFLAFFIFAKIFSSGYQHLDYTYDNFKVRYKRVREQEIQRLKNKNISPVEKKTTIESIEVLDKLILPLSTHETALNKIVLFFSSKSRDLKAAIQLQRDLEELSANDLFVASAKLSTTH